MSTLSESAKTNLIKTISLPSFSVHASAGTGKTYYLVSKIVECLLAGSSPDSILAITFTRKAAAEMQNRVIERLRGFSQASDVELNNNLAEYVQNVTPALKQRARGLYQRLLLSPYAMRISTFHAFCQEILQRFAIDADIPPGSSPTETVHNFREMAWQHLMQGAQAQPDSSLTASINLLFDYFSLESVKKLLSNFVASRTNWWAYTSHVSHKEAASSAIDNLTALYDIKDDTPPLITFFTDDDIQKDITLFSKLLLKNPTATNTNFANDIEQAQLIYSQAIESDTSPDNPDIAHKLIKSVFLTAKGEMRKRALNKTLQKKLADQADKFILLHEAIADHLIQLDEKVRCATNIKLINAWYQVGAALLDYFQKSKREQRTLDFDDLEWITYQLLTQSHQAQWVQYKIDTKLSHILIDEFQDTNQLQWRYIQPILAELATNRDDKPSNAILVGDIKQSIYSFRRAEPKLLNRAGTWLEDNFSAQSHSLDASYRSSPAIMNFVNEYFSHAENIDESFTRHKTMRDDLAGAVYLLQANLPEEEEPETGIINTHRNPLRTPRQQSEPGCYYYQAEMVAKKIKTLVNSKLELQDSDISRPVRYSDIYILFRNRSHVSEFEASLQRHNLPFIGLERGGLLDALEVTDILALLKWLITPHDNLSLAQILRSPIFSITNDELILLAEQNHKTGNWFERISKLASDLSADHKFVCVLNKLTHWRKLAMQLPVHDLLDTIYSEANILERYQQAFPEHLAARTTSNLLRLLEISLEIDSGRYPSLQKFLYELQNLKQSSDEMPDSPPLFGVNDRIQLLTIHAAKGLEAPVVFIADMNSTPADRDTYACVVDWPLSETKPKMLLPVFKKDMRDKHMQNILALNVQAQQQENLNLLYVAMTRAAQYLYLVGDSNSAEDTWFQSLVKLYSFDNEDEADCFEKELSMFSPDVATNTENPDKADTIISPMFDERLTKITPTPQLQHEIAPSYNENSDQQGHNEHGTQRGILIHEVLNLLTANPDAIDYGNPINEQTLRHRLNIVADDSFINDAINEATEVIKHTALSEFFSPDKYIKSYNEVPICYEQNKKMVNGIIDRLIEFEDNIVIIDYKSHQIGKNEIESIAAQYTQQMQYYRDGINLLWPDKPVSTYLIFTAIPLAYKITLQ